MANVQDSSNDGSSDDDDDDEDEEEDPMEESLVNLVGNTIKELAPAAQVFCRKQIILEKLGRMGIFSVVDLQTIMDADIQMWLLHCPPRHCSRVFGKCVGFFVHPSQYWF